MSVEFGKCLLIKQKHVFPSRWCRRWWSVADGGGGGELFFLFYIYFFFFEKWFLKTRWKKMLRGHFDGIGGYPDDDREKLYVSVRARGGLFLTTKTPPASALVGRLNVTVSGDYFFYVSSCWLLVPWTENTKINLVTIWSLLSLSFISLSEIVT